MKLAWLVYVEDRPGRRLCVQRSTDLGSREGRGRLRVSSDRPYRTLWRFVTLIWGRGIAAVIYQFVWAFWPVTRLSDAALWGAVMVPGSPVGASTLRSNIFKAIIQKLALTRTLLLTLSDPHDEAKKIYIFKPVAIHARRTNLSTHLPTASPKNVRFQKFKAQMASRWLHRSACQRGHPVIFH